MDGLIELQSADNQLIILISKPYWGNLISSIPADHLLTRISSCCRCIPPLRTGRSSILMMKGNTWNAMISCDISLMN